MKSGYVDNLDRLLIEEMTPIADWVDLRFEPGWKRRGSALSRTSVVVDHWTASPIRPGRELPSLRIVRDGLNRPDLGYYLHGPLYNVLADHDWGQPEIRVQLIAAGKTNNAGSGGWLGVTGNSRTIAGCFDSDGRAWTPRMVTLMGAINRALLRAINEDDVRRVCGHYEWTTRKIDPGRVGHRMVAIRSATAVSTPKEWDDMATEQQIEDAAYRGAAKALTNRHEATTYLSSHDNKQLLVYEDDGFAIWVTDPARIPGLAKRHGAAAKALTDDEAAALTIVRSA